MAKPGTLQDKNWEKDRKATARRKIGRSDKEETSKKHIIPKRAPQEEKA